MQLVINIDEKIYKRILPYKDVPIISNLANDYPEITYAIANGVPLPKGHGDLIDADELFLDIQTDEQMRLGEHLAWVKERIDNAPTIIEKDDEVEE